MSLLSDATLIFNNAAEDQNSFKKNSEFDDLTSSHNQTINMNSVLNSTSLYDEGLSIFEGAAGQLEQESPVRGSATCKMTAHERASKAKHEQRRSNLRRKRAREQMVQVVDEYIREQAAITTM